MRIAVIPARGGSKRIPRKNIRPFAGKPIIGYSIAAARESRVFDHILVSTDDAEIAAVAQNHGAEVPFMRPQELADDHTGTTDVIAHATAWALEQNWSLDAVCCIYATAPFLQPGDLQRGLELLESGPWLYAFSVTEFPSSIFRAFRLADKGGLEMLYPDQFETRSQDLPKVYHDAAQFSWGRPQAWTGRHRLFDRHSIPLILPRWRVQDIDTEDDWKQAEMIYETFQRKMFTVQSTQ